MMTTPALDPQEIATHLGAFGDAFRGEKFDARTLTSANGANAHLVGWGGAHMAHFVEAVSPVLTRISAPSWRRDSTSTRPQPQRPGQPMSRASETGILRRMALTIALGASVVATSGCGGIEMDADYPVGDNAAMATTRPTRTSPRPSQCTSGATLRTGTAVAGIIRTAVAGTTTTRAGRALSASHAGPVQATHLRIRGHYGGTPRGVRRACGGRSGGHR